MTDMLDMTPEERKEWQAASLAAVKAEGDWQPGHTMDLQQISNYCLQHGLTAAAVEMDPATGELKVYLKRSDV